jgi:tRNA dimethylallyltransferase
LSERAAIVVVGPTAVGKSSLAMDLATAHDAIEIVSADSMQVYRGLDIGTAKPGPTERAAVRHHLIDLVEPTEPYAVARFVSDADAVVCEIETRGATPLLVGGTGLYVSAFVDRFDIPDQFPEVRFELDAEPDTAALWRRLDQLDPLAASRMEPSNRRRVLRALEVTVGSGREFSSFGPGVDRYPQTPHLLIGLDLDRDRLDERIDRRFDAQMEAGFIDEVANLAETGIGPTARQALGYKELLGHLEGDLSLEDAVDEAKRRIRRFARRQQRWFRRDPRIEWFDASTETFPVVSARLADWTSAQDSSEQGATNI